MPSKGDTQINTFVGGLNTEASPLSFPPNSSLDEKNFRLNRNGSRDRRLGLDYEDDYALYDTGQTTDQIKVSRQRVFVWPTPSGWNQVEIGVIQVGTKLYFLDLFTANPSANPLHGGNSLDAADITNIVDNTVVFDFTIVNNNLIVVSEGLDTPFLLSYDYPSDTISYQTARIKIRDLYGVSDSLGDKERPASLSPEHEYNLRNQGWDSAVVTTCGTEVLACTQSVLGVYPSNSDTWSLGKIADVTNPDVDKYDPNTLARNGFDLGRAARGHFVIDLYDRGASRATESGIAQTNVDRELGRISTVAAMGGRLFYSGIRSRISGSDVSPKLSGAVLFSQLALTNEELVKCYQEADPTSPTSSDIVDTDGGIVQISEASNIVKLMQIKTSVFVFADNGIWEIRGDEGGFRATSFQVNKVSSIGVLSRDSIVEANGTIFFWANQGIFALTPNQFQTGYDTTNASINLIQTAYNSIPDLAKQNARGYYDVSQNRVRWLFNSDVPETITIPDPDPIVFGVGSIASIIQRQQPMMADIGNNRALVLYRENAGFINDAYYRIASIDSTTLGVTVTPEVNWIVSQQISSFCIVGLTIDKALIIYKIATSTNTLAVVANVSGDTVTLGTPVVIDTTHTGDLTRALFTAQLISAGASYKIIFGAQNTDNQKIGLQIIEVDLSDTITFGSVYKTATTGLTTPRIAVLTDVTCILATAGNAINTSSNMYPITLSGTVITIGTVATFTNNTQYPSGSHQFFLNDIKKLNSVQAVVFGCATINVTGTRHGYETFIVTLSGGLLTSTTTLFDDTSPSFDSSPTSIYGRIARVNNTYIAIAPTNTSVPRTFGYTIYTASSTPARQIEVVIDSGSTTTEHSYVENIGGGIVLGGYTKNDSSVDIRLFAVRIP
jgi:hypothetical protein